MLTWTLTVVALAAVGVLIAYHGRLRSARDRLDRLVRVNVDAGHRLALAWDELSVPPDAGPTGQDRTHAYAYDLDIVGHTSIAQRIGTPVSEAGWRLLYDWLLNPVAADEVAARQGAVAELAGQLDVRQEVEASGRRCDGAQSDTSALLAWAEGLAWLRRRMWVYVVAWISPICLIALALLQVLGVFTWPFWLIPLTINAVIANLVAAAASGLVAGIAPLHQALTGYREMFGVISAAPAKTPMLQRLRETLGSGPDGAVTRIGQLNRASTFAIPRSSALYFGFQLVFLWDIHVLAAFERWQRDAGRKVRTWLEAAGEWEALAALSVLAHDHPGWAFPRVNPAEDRLVADGLAHPLIAEREAVANDVAVGPVGTFLFVTGSNMSGKSTLLRAIGINAVLALAGGPVCARALRMPPVDVRTCMRVEDSLEHGVSFFLAELQRLKAVIDAADAASVQPVLWLLDEILQGTNTGERQIASRQVLAQLTGTRSFGAVSSHDLGLIEGHLLGERAELVHFAETFRRGPHGPDMSFDYRLQPGLATSTNALTLMELIGFDVDSTSDDETA